MESTLVRARWLVLDARREVEGGALLVEAGRVARVLGPGERAAAARTLDLGDAALTPGLVVAHAHTELEDLAGRVPPGEVFPEWIAALLAARPGLDPDASSRRGLRRLAAGGCVAVGDVTGSTGGAPVDAGVDAPLAVRFHEVLDAGDDERGDRAVRAATDAIEDAADRDLVGVSPHAPYTVSDATLRAVGELVRRTGVRVQVHVGETPEEEAWLRGSGGSFEPLLGTSRDRGATLDRLDRAGLLGPRTLLVHANTLRAEDVQRVAAAGAAVVHCPGTHAFFGRAPFDVDAWLAAGVRPALGTDSSASNAELDPRRELALAARSFPHVEPRELLTWATEVGAAAIGLSHRVGRIEVGRPFTAAAFESGARHAAELFEQLVLERPPVLATWVEGRVVHVAPGLAAGS